MTRSKVLASLPLSILSPLLFLVGCGSTATTFVHANDTTLGRVVVYRNGVAYFERTAEVQGDALELRVPADKVDDFLKSLTVVDAKTGKPAPISYPTKPPTSQTGLVDMKIGLTGPSSHKLRLSYVTEAPSWKPSYRVVLDKDGKVDLEAWAIVDNTSGEDWKDVRLGVGSSSALSFRFDLQSVRLVERETLQQNDLLALAPPTGGASYGGEAPQKKLVAELDDTTLRAVADNATTETKKKDERESRDGAIAGNYPPPAPPAQAGLGGHGTGAGGAVVGHASGYGRGDLHPSPTTAIAAPKSAPAEPVNAATAELERMTRSLRGSSNNVMVEGFASAGDSDKEAASLDRANRLREELVRNGIDARRIVAVGRGERAGRAGGARVVEASPEAGAGSTITAPTGGPAGTKTGADQPGANAAGAIANAAEPIGTSHFESTNVTSVARGTSAMVSILKTKTDGEVVYLYDPESARGNAQFPFKSVRLKNPSDSALETGPVTVFGEGRFIGEGMAEPIPAGATAFVPFALDRQIVVERKDGSEDQIARVLTVQRGVFSAEVQHKKTTTFTLVNRLAERAVVYVRHTVTPGYTLSDAAPAGSEKLGNANLVRVVIEPHATTTLAIREATPIFKTIDVRSPDGIEQVRAYLSHAAVAGPLKQQVEDLLRLNKEMADTEQHITTTRDQMAEYRQRMDEIHAQLFTLKAVKTAGPLMQSLEKKMQDMSDRLTKATVDVVTLQEKLMVSKIHFQDGVADLSLEKSEKDAAKTATR